MGLIAGAGIGAMTHGAVGGIQRLAGIEPPDPLALGPDDEYPAPLAIEDLPRATARAKAKAEPMSPYYGSGASSSSSSPQRMPFGVNWAPAVPVPTVFIDLTAEDPDTEDAEDHQGPAAAAARPRRVRRDRRGGFENIADRDVAAAHATLAAMPPLPPRRNGRGPPLPDLPGT